MCNMTPTIIIIGGSNGAAGFVESAKCGEFHLESWDVDQPPYGKSRDIIEHWASLVTPHALIIDMSQYAMLSEEYFGVRCLNSVIGFVTYAWSVK